MVQGQIQRAPGMRDFYPHEMRVRTQLFASVRGYCRSANAPWMSSSPASPSNKTARVSDRPAPAADRPSRRSQSQAGRPGIAARAGGGDGRGWPSSWPRRNRRAARP